MVECSEDGDGEVRRERPNLGHALGDRAAEHVDPATRREHDRGVPAGSRRREARHDDRETVALECHDMVGLAPLEREGRVVRRLVETGIRCTVPQECRHKPELRDSFVVLGQRDFRRRWAERCEEPCSLGEIDRSAVVRVDKREVPQLGTLVEIRHPGTREQECDKCQRRASTVLDQLRRRKEPFDDCGEDAVLERVGDESLEFILVVCDRVLPDVWTPDSRTALRMKSTARVVLSGHAPITVWKNRYRVGASRPAGRTSRVVMSSACTRSRHGPGNSESAHRRARTSALRFVSWVESVSMLVGLVDAMRDANEWEVLGGVPYVPGSPPTSLSASIRW